MMQESRRSIHRGTIGTLLTVFFISATADAVTTINVPPSPDSGSAAADTIVNLLPSGSIGSTFHANSGSILNVQGGSLGGATIHGGAVGNIYSGNVYGMYATSGGVINAYDGLINNLTADSNGVLNVYGGNIIDNVDSNSSSVNIYGGAFADRFQIRVGSQLTVKATEFRLNGLSVAGLNNPSDATMIAAPPGSFLSGVFSNGVPFVLGGEGYNLPSSVNLVRSADYATGPSFISVPAVSAPQGVHSGQTLTVSTAGQLPSSFTA